MNVADTPTDELSPTLLSSKSAFTAWAILYSALYTTLMVYLVSKYAGVSTSGHAWGLAAAIILPPQIIYSDLYVRLIWLPYRKEIRRRSLMSSLTRRDHPYDIERKMLGTLFLLPALVALGPLTYFFGYEKLSNTSRYASLIPLSCFAQAVFSYAILKSCFYYDKDDKLRKDVPSDRSPNS